ncbi:MAG: hypothetical protein ABIT36_06440 [Steroidobacteraceae bacterium]
MTAWKYAIAFRGAGQAELTGVNGDKVLRAHERRRQHFTGMNLGI